VKFFDKDNNQIGATQTVNYGGNATAPTAPAVTGYTFAGWDKSYSNVTEDLIVTATYAINTYTVKFFDKDNNLRGKGMYGVPFTAEQANALIEGKAVVHTGQRKDGETFTCCIQFDAARREPAVSHPSWFKEAQRAGMEMTPKQRQEQQEKSAKQHNNSQEHDLKKSGGLKK
jgi:hypothetical protein